MRRIAASNDNSRGASNSQYAVTQRSNVQELSEGGNLEGGNLGNMEGGNLATNVQGNLADEFSPLSIDDNRISSPGPQAVRQAETSSSREDLIAENLVQASRVASGVESGTARTELSADNLVGDEASEEGDNLVGSEEEEEVEADQSESRRVMREEEVTSEREQTSLIIVINIIIIITIIILSMYLQGDQREGPDRSQPRRGGQQGHRGRQGGHQ